jgi:hypothetical protein
VQLFATGTFFDERGGVNGFFFFLFFVYKFYILILVFLLRSAYNNGRLRISIFIGSRSVCFNLQVNYLMKKEKNVCDDEIFRIYIHNSQVNTSFYSQKNSCFLNFSTFFFNI